MANFLPPPIFIRKRIFSFFYLIEKNRLHWKPFRIVLSRFRSAIITLSVVYGKVLRGFIYIVSIGFIMTCLSCLYVQKSLPNSNSE